MDAILKVFLGTNNDTIAYIHALYTCSLTGGRTGPLAGVPYKEQTFTAHYAIFLIGLREVLVVPRGIE